MDNANTDCVCSLQITVLEPPPEREEYSWQGIKHLFS
jgi:hypothetical protein